MLSILRSFPACGGSSDRRGRALLVWIALSLYCAVICVAKKNNASKDEAGSPLVGVGRQDCPPCSGLFSKLDTDPDGKQVQDVTTQLHGEPKTGTTMMTSWAFGTLVRTCEHLQTTYGQASCRINPDITKKLSGRVTLTFEPGLARDDGSSCACDTVDMVRITVSVHEKHRLPVDAPCRWQHPFGLALAQAPCKTAKGRPVATYTDIWACMQEASCKIERDNTLRFAPLRDPRAAAVSTYFHARRTNKGFTRSLDTDEGVLRLLPAVAQWMALRYTLFEGLMANSSETFWYEDANQDPLDWHFRWTELAGLRLPTPWIESITSLRLEGPWVDLTVGINPHPGGKEKSATRTWRDEVSPGIIEEMNSIVRTWLPGVLLARLGIPT